MSTLPLHLPLASSLHVRESGVRAIHVVYDLAQATVADGYIVTTQVRQSLGRIAAGLEPKASQRAWTLTGPYGSGKSYFGLFAMNLLGKGLPGHKAAQAQLEGVDSALLAQIQRLPALKAKRGLLPIPITGFRGSIHNCLRDGCRQALQPLANHPAIQELLEDDFFHLSSVDSRGVIQWLQRLQSALTAAKAGYGGILLTIDEMGKMLEFAANHPTEVDLYLLQELAEFANRSGDTPFVMVGILHQPFDRYVGHLDAHQQREWSKIQGRFEDIAFQEPPHQQMHLVQRAISIDDAAIAQTVAPLMTQVAKEAADAGWRPPLMREEEFLQVAAHAYPLQPPVLVALPYLFRRLAQNERSIFAFLTAHEPFGLQEFLHSHHAPDMLSLADLFDYLVVNFQGRLYTTLRARAITETLARLENSANLPPLAVEALKCVGLLNWLAENSPLLATTPTLMAALRRAGRTDEVIEQTLERLRNQSLLVYRRFNQSYSVWQGSDVDLEEELAQARRQLSSGFSLAGVIQEYLPPRPLVARRHSYLTGATHFFDVRYIDATQRESLNLTPPAGAAGILLHCLPANPTQGDEFIEWATGELSTQRQVVVGINQRTALLAELCQELRALQWVREQTPDLRDDPVARREVRARFHQLETLIRNELERTLTPTSISPTLGEAGAAMQWFYAGEEFTAHAAQGNSYLLSAICARLYPQQPSIRNEIINRHALSSQGAAARRNLIEAMLSHSSQARLGLEGFPPERSIYESFLYAGGLHQETEPGLWGFAAPSDARDPLHLLPAWRAIEAFLFEQTPAPRGVDLLFAQLAAPPYGVTGGVLPLLLCAFWLVYMDEVTLYQEGTLLPSPAIADWEVLLRRPELFALAGCRVVGPRAAVVKRMAAGLQTKAATMPVVRELVRRLKSLPEHAWRTQRLSAPTLALRRVVEAARAPEQLLFVELPQSLNLPPFSSDATYFLTRLVDY